MEVRGDGRVGRGDGKAGLRHILGISEIVFCCIMDNSGHEYEKVILADRLSGACTLLLLK